MSMEKILKLLINFGLYLVLIIPFIVIDNMFFPYITGKAFVFRIIIGIIFCLWLILILKYQENRPKWSYLTGAFGVFIIVLLLANINALAPHKAFWGNYERMEGWISFVHFFAYFLIIGAMFNKKSLWLWFFRVNIFVASVLAIQSIAEGVKTEVIRIAGPLGNPIYISVYFLFIFFLGLILLHKDVLKDNLVLWKDFKKVFINILFYLYLFVSLLSLYIIYRTSRGALLGVIGGIFLGALLITILGRELKVIRQIAFGGIVLVICLLITFIAFRDTSFVKNNPTLSRLAVISWNNTSGQARQLIWPIAIEGFKERPLLGWGQEGFNYVFNKYYNPALYGQESWFDRAHNAPLDFLVAGGMLGFLSYFSLFICALYLLWFKKKNIDIVEKVILTSLLAGYLFQALFVFDNLVSYIMFFLILAYIHFCSVEVLSDNLDLPERRKAKSYLDYFFQFTKDEEYQNYIIIPIIIILTTVGLWWINIPSIRANQDLILALNQIRNKNITSGINLFQSALAQKALGDPEIREQLISSAFLVFKMTDVDQGSKDRFYNLVRVEMDKQIQITPVDARYHFLMGSLLNIISPEEATLYLEKAIELSPQKQAMRFQLIKNLYSLGKISEGMSEAKLVYELDKSYEQARLLYLETVKNEIKHNLKFKDEGLNIIKTLELSGN